MLSLCILELCIRLSRLSLAATLKRQSKPQHHVLETQCILIELLYSKLSLPRRRTHYFGVLRDAVSRVSTFHRAVPLGPLTTGSRARASASIEAILASSYTWELARMFCLHSCKFSLPRRRIHCRVGRAPGARYRVLEVPVSGSRRRFGPL